MPSEKSGLAAPSQTIAGNGTCDYTATMARLCRPRFVIHKPWHWTQSETCMSRTVATTLSDESTPRAGSPLMPAMGHTGMPITEVKPRRHSLRVPSAWQPMPRGIFYVSDWSANRVHKIAANGTISLVAGTGASGYSGEGGLATAAQLKSPGHLALDGSGSKLYIADEDNHVVRKVEGGIITTVAGTPACCGTASDATHVILAPRAESPWILRAICTSRRPATRLSWRCLGAASG